MKKTKQPFGELKEEKPAAMNRVYSIGETTDVLIATVCDTYQLTSNLRWKGGVLEQSWVSMTTGKSDWRPVPIVPLDPVR